MAGERTNESYIYSYNTKENHVETYLKNNKNPLNQLIEKLHYDDHNRIQHEEKILSYN